MRSMIRWYFRQFIEIDRQRSFGRSRENFDTAEKNIVTLGFAAPNTKAAGLLDIDDGRKYIGALPPIEYLIEVEVVKHLGVVEPKIHPPIGVSLARFNEMQPHFVSPVRQIGESVVNALSPQSSIDLLWARLLRQADVIWIHTLGFPPFFEEWLIDHPEIARFWIGDFRSTAVDSDRAKGAGQGLP